MDKFNEEESLARYISRREQDMDIGRDDHILNRLAKELAMNKIIDEDKPLKDATAQMLIMAQGPRSLAYASPELTSAMRVSNAVRKKDPYRLTGLPSKSDLLKMVTDREIRDKQLWRATGNGIKVNQWGESVSQ